MHEIQQADPASQERASFGTPPSRNDNERRHGVVEMFNRTRGFGFILDDVGQRKIYVHFSQIEDQDANAFRWLQEGDRVSYQTSDSPDRRTGRLQAFYVRVDRAR